MESALIALLLAVQSLLASHLFMHNLLLSHNPPTLVLSILKHSPKYGTAARHLQNSWEGLAMFLYLKDNGCRDCRWITLSNVKLIMV